MVSTSAFLACHQRYCAGSGLAWGLNFRALVCGIFWSLSPKGFLPVIWFPPLLRRFNGSVHKIKLSKCDLNSVKLNSLSCPSVPRGTRHMLHVISVRCFARDLHTGRLSIHFGDSSRRSEEIVKNLELRL